MLILIDPHAKDFIYKPLLFWFLKKRPFRKYAYIHNALELDKKINVFFTYKKSSIPDRFFNKIPLFLQKYLIKLEIYFWKKINKININEVLNINTSLHDAFIFGRGCESVIGELTTKFKKVFVHLSHYHGFKDFGGVKEDNLFFCADNDISLHHYFKNKYPWYKNGIQIVPFCVEDRFSNATNLKRKKKCAVTGTYHNLPREVADFGIYNSLGNTTLHPLRFELANYESNLIEKKLSLFGYKDPLTKQKKYFSFNIVDFYRSFNYAIVPGEGNGLIGIGSLESLACGCTIFLTEWEAKGLLNEGEYIAYDGTLEDFMSKLRTAINKETIINLDENVSNRFKADFLVDKFKNNFVNI